MITSFDDPKIRYFGETHFQLCQQLRRKYPVHHWIEAGGVHDCRPQDVEKKVGKNVARIPFPDHKSVCWLFQTQEHKEMIFP